MKRANRFYKGDRIKVKDKNYECICSDREYSVFVRMLHTIEGKELIFREIFVTPTEKSITRMIGFRYVRITPSTVHYKRYKPDKKKKPK